MEGMIRAAAPDDAAAIAGVHVASLRASATDLLPAHLTPIVLPPADAAPRARAWKRWIERERTSTFVSLAGATVTGFCTLHPATHDVRAGAGGAEPPRVARSRASTCSPPSGGGARGAAWAVAPWPRPARGGSPR